MHESIWLFIELGRDILEIKIFSKFSEDQMQTVRLKRMDNVIQMSIAGLSITFDSKPSTQGPLLGRDYMDCNLIQT